MTSGKTKEEGWSTLLEWDLEKAFGVDINKITYLTGTVPRLLAVLNNLGNRLSDMRCGKRIPFATG
jgi:hypothetical protein